MPQKPNKLYSQNKATRQGAKLGEQFASEGVGAGKFKTKEQFQSALGGKLASGDITKQQYKGFKKKPSSFSYESIFGKGFDPYKT